YIHPFGQDATKSLHFATEIVQFGVDAHSVLAKVYGGQGPLSTWMTSGSRAATRSRSALRSDARSVGTKTARETATLSLVHVSCQTSWRSIACPATTRSTIDSACARWSSRAAILVRRASM